MEAFSLPLAKKDRLALWVRVYLYASRRAPGVVMSKAMNDEQCLRIVYVVCALAVMYNYQYALQVHTQYAHSACVISTTCMYTVVPGALNVYFLHCTMSYTLLVQG